MKNKGLLIIGLDGFPYDFYSRFGRDYAIDNLLYIIKNWEVQPLLSSVPYNSASGWTSFLTGLDSGDHGIFDINVRDTKTYKYRIENKASIGYPTFFQEVNKAKIKTLSLNLPMTYPFTPGEGEIIAGPFVPDYGKLYTNSEKILNLLNSGINDYKTDIDFKQIEAGNLKGERLLKGILRLTSIHCDAFTKALRGIDWELAVVTLTTVDRLFHYFWGYIDPSHRWYTRPEGERIRKLVKTFFWRLDLFLGEILDFYDSNTDIIIVSDHGFGPLDRVIYITNYLIRWGYFCFSASEEYLKKKKEIHRDPLSWGRTSVFPGGASSLGVYINDTTRFAKGNISPQNYIPFRKELQEKLLTIKNPKTNDPIITSIIHREEIVKGKRQYLAPDIFLWGNNMRDVGSSKIRTNGIYIEESLIRSGSHRPEGFFAAKGEKILKKVNSWDKLKIHHICPIILDWFNCPDNAGNTTFNGKGQQTNTGILSALEALGYI